MNLRRRPSSSSKTCQLSSLLFLAILGCASLAADEPNVPNSGTSEKSEPGEVSPKEARDESQAAGAALYYSAVERLRGGHSADQVQAQADLRKAAAMENPFAQSLLAECLLFGLHDFRPDPPRGVTLLQLAAQSGSAYPKIRYAELLIQGKAMKRDLPEAEKLLRAALSKEADFSLLQRPESAPGQDVPAAIWEAETISGEIPVHPRDRALAQAHFLLGEILSEHKQFAEAQQAYVLASTQGEASRAGHVQAASKAALNYAFGKGTPRDPKKASEMLTLRMKLMKRQASSAAHRLVQEKKVDAFAQSDTEEEINKYAQMEQLFIQASVADRLTDKKSKDYAPKEAVQWLELAIEDKQTWAHAALGLLYLNKDLGTPDPKKAFEHFTKAVENSRDTLSWCNYAICLEKGIGTTQDLTKARAIFEKYKEEDIIASLGVTGKCPSAPLSATERFELCQKQAKKKDPQAQFLLAIAYAYGINVEKDQAKANDYMKRALDAGNAGALVSEGNAYENMADNNALHADEYRRKAFASYLAASKKKSLHGLYNLARCHASGIGTELNEDKAAEIYKQCLEIDPGYSLALNNLSTIHYNRYVQASIRLDEEKAEKLKGIMLESLETAHAQGLALASANLGSLHYHGYLGKKDMQKAFQYFDEAANKGNLQARRMLGIMLENGQGMPYNYTEAAYHYRIAALGGDEFAINRLVEFYRSGLGVTRDLDRAIQWLQVFADKGNRNAKISLASIFRENGREFRAYALLSEVYNNGIEQQKAAAAYQLSVMAQNGVGSPSSISKAASYFAYAFKCRNPDALCDQALIHIGKAEYEQALPLLAEASKQAHAKSQYVLGCLYMKGQGLTKDSDKAWPLIKAAARNGHNEAKTNIALGTLKGFPSMPSLDEAITYAEEAEAAGQPNAKLIREALEKKRKAQPSQN